MLGATTLRIMCLFATISINETEHKSIASDFAKCRYAERRDFFILMLSVVMRHDIQYNDTQHNDIEHNKNETQHSAE
jgi:hypothetical protein